MNKPIDKDELMYYIHLKDDYRNYPSVVENYSFESELEPPTLNNTDFMGKDKGLKIGWKVFNQLIKIK